MAEPNSDHPKPANRLAKESSPYLLQHQHNPVDWYSWGPEAFEAAKREDKPIFLSVGYSTCYWCHVMERQSFENEQIAMEMNKRFINIKVDREERPDVDQLYMAAIQVLTRQGGWPMSVFLTPDLKPFYGGTYFPPTDQHGRHGFPSVLRAIEDAYKNRREDVQKTTAQLMSILNDLAEPEPPRTPITMDDDFIESLIDRSIADYDPRNGGFGAAPKFPRQTLLELLLTYLSGGANGPASDITGQEDEKKSRILKMVLHTLDAIAQGGIRDHLGGGFHRYSTDVQWLVPHFEIMLYDNAMLAWCYIEAYRQTENLHYALIARGIFDFILREMTSPQGAFYTAFDAEVDAREGLSYLWTQEETDSLLSPEDAKFFNAVYGVDRGPNFADPHHGTGQPDKSILFLAEPIETFATRNKLDAREVEARLEAIRHTLLAARSSRKQPLLDTKILTSWNALMIRALSYGGQILQEQKYLDAAARAADYLLRHHRTPAGGLYRGSRDDVPKYEGFLDDYAFSIHALLALRDGSGKDLWKDHAAALAIVMLDKFADPDKGGFYFTAKDAADLIVRQKTASDSPLPSGNAAAAMAMLVLDQPQVARDTLAIFAEQMKINGEGMSSMIEAAIYYLRHNEPLTVSAAAESAAADRPLSPQQIAGGAVSIKAAWSSQTQLNVHVNILRGFHINAHEPSLESQNIEAKGSQIPPLQATQLTVSGSAAEEVEAIDYPPGEQQRFVFTEAPLRVYTGDITIAIRFKNPQTGQLPIQLGLYYQACDDSACLPPVTKQLEVVTM